MKRTLLISFLAFLISSIAFVYFEAGITNAASDTEEIDVTLDVTAEITLTSPGNISMSPDLDMTNDGSVGTGDAWNVKTSNQAGYKLELKADEDNCLTTGSESFTDYTESTAGTPESWSVSSAYEFGFSVYGTDVSTGTWGDYSACGSGGAGSPTTYGNYMGFSGTNNIEVATKAEETPVAGVDTVLCVAAEQEGVYAPSGSYTADITGTATTL